MIDSFASARRSSPRNDNAPFSSNRSSFRALYDPLRRLAIIIVAVVQTISHEATVGIENDVIVIEVLIVMEKEVMIAIATENARRRKRRRNARHGKAVMAWSEKKGKNVMMEANEESEDIEEKVRKEAREKIVMVKENVRGGAPPGA